MQESLCIARGSGAVAEREEESVCEGGFPVPTMAVQDWENRAHRGCPGPQVRRDVARSGRVRRRPQKISSMNLYHHGASASGSYGVPVIFVQERSWVVRLERPRF